MKRISLTRELINFCLASGQCLSSVCFISVQCNFLSLEEVNLMVRVLPLIFLNLALCDKPFILPNGLIGGLEAKKPKRTRKPTRKGPETIRL